MILNDDQRWFRVYLLTLPCHPLIYETRPDLCHVHAMASFFSVMIERRRKTKIQSEKKRLFSTEKTGGKRARAA